MTKEIVNRVQNSGLITLEMKSFYGDQERELLDIKHWLYEGLILKEKPFRNHLKNHVFKEKPKLKSLMNIKKIYLSR